MTSRRSLAAVSALAVLLALAFPLLSSIFSDLAGNATVAVPPATPVALVAAPTSTESPTATSTTTPTATATATASPTPSPTNTPTLTPSPTPTTTPSMTPTPTATFTPTPLPRVYLMPFVQVFAVGQTQLSSSTQVLMYEGGADIFEVLATQGTFTRLQTLDRALNLWTGSSNISPFQPPAAQYDYSVKGQTAKLSGTSVFACAYNERPTLAFGACQQLANVTTAVLNARVVAGSTVLFIAEINNALFVVPASAIVGQ